MPKSKTIYLNNILRNAATVISGLLIGATVSLINSPGAQAAVASTYNPTLARNYSNTYTCNGSNCRNSAYVNLGGTDCTNFVSQALKAGNFPTSAGWYYSNGTIHSASWVQVAAFKNFMVDQAQYAYIASPGMTSTYTTASIGDVYMYDWGHGDGYSHLSFAYENENHFVLLSV